MFTYAVDVTKHHDVDGYVTPKLVSKKLWIVPGRVEYEDVLEHVCQGMVVARPITPQEFVDGL